MKTLVKYKFQIIAILPIIIALLGYFDHSSFVFVKSINEKNLVFLGLLADVKLVLAGLHDVKIPFISGGAEELSNSFNSTEKYLLVANTISLFQLMLLLISKSIYVKLILVLFFVLSFLKPTKVLFTKLLVIAIVLNPGLSLFTKSVELVSQEAKFDFGSKYALELKDKVSYLKAEQAQLMKEHEQALTQIEKGKRDIEFFRKLKQDVSYDFKELKVHIEGDYLYIRELLQSGGEEMLTKLLNFVVMVFFALFFLPMVYAFMVYIVYKHLFGLGKYSIANVNEFATLINTHFEKLHKELSLKNVDNKIHIESSIKKKIESLKQKGDTEVEK